MLGDGECQEECYTESCEFDKDDCYCSPGCGPEDKGKCKVECMVPACSYDDFGTEGGCKDDLLLTLSYMYQSSRYNFKDPFNSTACFEICSHKEFAGAYKTHACLNPTCMIDLCVHGLGGCEVEMEVNNCKVMDKGTRVCIECAEGEYLFSKTCVNVPPRGYAPFGQAPNYLVQTLDKSSSIAPDVLYVFESTDPEYEGDGTYPKPYENLVVALSAVWEQYSVINLLGERLSTYCDPRKVTSDLLAVADRLKPLAGKEFQLLTIQSLPCDRTNHPRCSASFSTIDVSSLLLFNFTGNVLFQNVIFTSTGAFSSTPPYTYCPLLITNANGLLIDDRGNKATDAQKLARKVCEKFQWYSLFTINPESSLTFKVSCSQDVNVTDFRIEMASLIDIVGGNVVLERVRFVNVTADGGSASHAIVTQNASCTTPFCGSFSFTGGVVQYVSNGFEYSDLATLSGFLSAHSINSVSITNVDFTYCLSTDSSSSELVSGYSLLSLQDFTLLAVTNCSFEANVVTGGVITIKSSVDLPKTSVMEIAVAYALPHITLSELNFTNNFAAQSLINMLFSKDLLNVAIEKCVFVGNAVGQALVSIVNNQAVNSLIAVGGKKSVVISQPRVKATLWFPPRNLTISNVAFVNDSSYTALVRIENCANLRITNFRAENSGDSVRDKIKQVFQLLIANVESGVRKLPSSTDSTNCSSSLYFEAVTNVLTQNVQVQNCTCSSGGVGLVLTKAAGAISASDWFVRKSNGKGTSGLALHFSGALSLTLTNITVDTCVMDGNGMVYFQDYTVVNMSGSRFDQNTGERGACLRADGGLFLTLSNSTFTRNSSPTNVGGVLAFTLDGSKPLKAEVTDCTFTHNSATEGGVLAFGGFKVLVLELTLLRNYFLNSVATDKAAVLTIQPTITLAASSVISNCTFQGNESPYGAISAMQYSGALLITSSSFIDNIGALCACLHIETHQNAQNILRDVLFLGSKKGPAVLKTNPRTQSHLQSQRCTHQNSEMGAVSLEGGDWVDDNSTYSGLSSTALSLTMGATANTTRAVFLNNTSGKEGGAVYLGSKSHFSCQQCLFRNNSARIGAAVYSEQDSAASLRQSVIEGNLALGSGSAISLITSLNSESVLSNCTLRHNTAKQSALIISQDAVLTLDSIAIYENRAADYPGIYLILSKLTMVNSEMRSQQASSSPFLYIATRSTASIRSSDFADGSGQFSGAIIIVSSDVYIADSTFFNIVGDQTGVISAASDCNVTLTGVLMTNIVSKSAGSLVAAIDSALWVTNSQFAQYKEGGIEGIKMSVVEVTESSFAYGSGSSGSAVSCTQCTKVSVSRSSFTYHQGLLGGAIYLETLEGAATGGDFVITSTDFRSNTALAGGAIYLLNMQMEMDKCSFADNSATGESGEGGALMLRCEIAEYCQAVVSNTVFQANSAVLKGGAMSWTLSKPATSSVSMHRNKAQYAPDIASFPVQLAMEEVSAGRSVKVRNSTEIWEVPPGQDAGLSFNVSLVDHYGHIVNIDNSNYAEITSADSAAFISGRTKVTAVNGTFIFNEFRVFAVPKTAVSIRITTSAIPETESDPDSQHPALPLVFNMRGCLPGESKTDRSCYVCESGTYGFDPSQPCEKCPNNAICLGNYTIYPNSGYWRSGVYSARIWECPNRDACRGGEYTYNLTGECATGYSANMCQSCAPGYSRSTKNKCGKCPDRKTNIIRISFIAVGALIMNVVMVLSTLNSSLKPKALHSIYLKILMNYLQLVLLVTDFKLAWPDPVLEVFDAQEKSGEVAEQAYSIDCILEEENRFDTDIFFQKVIVMSILPLLIFGLAILVWGLAAMYKKKPVYLSRELAATCIISFFMIHPNLMLLLLSVFSCTEINSGEYWLTRDMKIRCWESDHLYYSLVLAVPASIVWIIVAPLICLAILVKNRRRQDEADVKMRFGFLISGYHRRHYYWEFVIMYRKFAIICCSVFINNSVSIQALTVQLVILGFLFLQHNILPYTEEILNSLELKAILVADLTIYCGLYYLTNDLSSASSWFFFYLILLSNLIFLAYWLICFLDFAKRHMIKNIPVLARIIAPEVLDSDAYIDEFVESVPPKPQAADFDVGGHNTKSVFLKILSSTCVNTEKSFSKEPR